MIDITLAAYVFTVLTVVVILFQLALALGAPWGEMAMGGKYPGRLPYHIRIIELVQINLLIIIILIVLTRAGVIWEAYYALSRSAIWFVVGLNVLGTVLNLMTPSKKERMIWGPVTVVLLGCSLVVASS